MKARLQATFRILHKKHVKCTSTPTPGCNLHWSAAALSPWDLYCLLPMLLWIIATYIMYTASLCRETNNFSCLRLELPKGTIFHISVKFQRVMITYLKVHWNLKIIAVKTENWISLFRLKVSDVETVWTILGILRCLSSSLWVHKSWTVIINLSSGLYLQELYILEIKQIKIAIQHLFLPGHIFP